MRYFRKMMGKHLYLSPVNGDDGDAEKYVQWMNNEAVASNFGQYYRVVSSRNDLRWIYEPGNNMQRYAMVLIEGDEMIGSISIHNIDHLNRNAYIGIFIGEDEHRGKGYGAEAIGLIVEYGFNTLNLHNIMLTVHADNYAGISCYKKVGFREVGRLPEFVFKDGQYTDKVIMGISARDYTK